MSASLLLLLAFALPAFDETPTYRKGDWVVVVHWNAGFEREGERVADAELGNAYVVGSVEEGQIYVRLVDAWISTEDVLPYAQAQPYFTSLIEAAPDAAVVWFSRGVFLMKKGDLDAALADMDRAVSLSPDEASYHVGRGNVRLRRKDYEQAIADYDKAIQLNAYDPAAWNGRGLARKALRQFDEAIADLTESINLQPGNAATWANRGMTRAAAKDFQGAVQDHTEAHRLEPKDAEHLRRRALDRWELRDVEGALSDFDAALQLAGHPVQILIDRGDRLAWIGRYEESLDSYNAAVARRFDDHRGYGARAWLLATCPVERYRDARQALSDAGISCEMTKYQGRWNVESLAAAFAESGDFEKAVAWQRKAIELIPADAKEQSREDSRNRLSLYQQGHAYHMPLPLRLRLPVEAPR